MSSPRTPGRRTRSLFDAAVVALLFIALLVAALPVPPAGAGSSAWTKPVPGGIVRSYREPLARFASGHRGVDFSAQAGTPVRAANAGTVTFAGTVGGEQHVVVSHPGGIRTSYSYLAHIDVKVGAHVARGAVLGTAGGTGAGHGRGVVHFGARVGSRYFDPMLLFGPTDLTKLVRLIPSDDGSVSDEEMLGLLIDGEDDDNCAGGIPLIEQACDAAEAVGGAISDAGEWAWDRVEEAIQIGLDAVRAVSEAAKDLADRIESLVRDVLRTLRDVAEGVADAVAKLAEQIANGAADLFNEVVEAGVEILEWLTSCPQPPALAHPRGSGNAVLAVGGLGSSSWRKPGGGSTPSFGFQSAALGYDADDVGYFSYAPDSPAYTPEDTYGDLHAKARMLGEQIKDFARVHPGRNIDLVAHSQGGVVIDLFLLEVLPGHEKEYPKIENVVTFASPHQGTPLATFDRAIDKNMWFGPIARELMDDDLLTAVSVAQLAEKSDTIEGLWADDAKVPSSVRYLSIVGAEDAVVPSSSADVPGGTKVIVPVGTVLLPDDHRNVLSDDDAISAAQAHLGGGFPADACGVLEDVGGATYSDLVRFVTNKVSLGEPADPPGCDVEGIVCRRRLRHRVGALAVAPGPAWGKGQGSRYTPSSTRVSARDLSGSQHHPGRTASGRGASEPTYNLRSLCGCRHHEAASGGRGPLRSPDAPLEPEDASFHLRGAQRDLHHRPPADAGADRYRLPLHPQDG
ncbi:MAG: hypothetical protein EXQ79_05165 [Acidimicrobiia bacterium]|nr:hypothetical protein [Acidimicrobiia bacterium]